MLDQQHRDAAVADLADDGDDLQDLGRVQPGHHLVEQQQARRGGQRACEFEALAAGDGEVGRGLREHVLHADLARDGMGVFPGLVAVRVLLVGTHGDVLVHRELGERLRDLEGAHHAGARDLVYRHAGDVLPEQFHPPAVDRVETGDAGEQGGLSCAIGADQRHDAALVDLQRGVVDGAQAAEDLGQSGDFEHQSCFRGLGLRRRNRSIRPLGR